MGKTASAMWAQASQVALDWLFPPRCAGCGALGNVWCATCQADAIRIAEPFCEHCGLPLSGAARCSSCASHPYVFDASRSWGVYSGVLRQAILSMKHRNHARLGAALAANLQQVFAAQDWKVDVLIPIPLGAHRFKQRGYNQVEALARPLSEHAGLRYAENVLARRHDTLPQFELNASQRWSNPHGSFAADPSTLAGMSVLLVDDIMTTGATLDAAAQALREAGAKKVYAITLARTL